MTCTKTVNRTWLEVRCFGFWGSERYQAAWQKIQEACSSDCCAIWRKHWRLLLSWGSRERLLLENAG